MYKLIYTPRALNDLIRIKEWIIQKHGSDVAKISMRKLTATARQLEYFPKQGSRLEYIIQRPTEYRFIFVKPNYIIYRIEENIVKIIRVLNEKEDFMQILFGIIIKI